MIVPQMCPQEQQKIKIGHNTCRQNPKLSRQETPNSVEDCGGAKGYCRGHGDDDDDDDDDGGGGGGDGDGDGDSDDAKDEDDDEDEDEDEDGDGDDDMMRCMLRTRRKMMMLREENRSRDREAHFVRACAVEMHMSISQEPFCVKFTGKIAGDTFRDSVLCEPAQ